VNFVRVHDDGTLHIRTYERGVEDETLACGTGSVASALLASSVSPIESPASLLTWGSELLNVHFEKEGDAFSNVFLEGDTTVVYDGVLWDEATE
jgi:diaminopimelate epimerase